MPIKLKVKPLDPRLAELESIRQAIAKGESLELEADSMLLARVQLAVLKGELPAEAFTIEFHKPEWGTATINPDGYPEPWPRGFLSEDNEVFREIVLERRKKYPETT